MARTIKNKRNNILRLAMASTITQICGIYDAITHNQGVFLIRGKGNASVRNLQLYFCIFSNYRNFAERILAAKTLALEKQKNMYIQNEDTIFAPATIPGTGAISVIRISGSQSLNIADKLVHCIHGNISDAPGYSLKFGRILDSDGSLVDEVVVSIFKAPRSYTGENSVELSCHASSYIVNTISDLLREAGARFAEPGEFTQRAFLNGKMDLSQAEAVADVIAAQSKAAHKIAFNQMKGGYSTELKTMRDELLKIVSLMELELDFSEEEVEFADRTELNSLLDEIIAHISRLVDSFRLGNAIKNGIPVAIAGQTNTGKSTLLNALLGEDRAIVSDVHGTTRDTIEETLNIDGVLFRFIDTAGIRETSEIVEKIGIEKTFKKIHQASIVLGMLDLCRCLEDNAESLSEILSQVDLDTQELVLLFNKADALGQCSCNGVIGSDSQDNKNVKANNIIISLLNNQDIKQRNIQSFPISAKTGYGLEELRKYLSSSQKDKFGDGSITLVTNQRHLDALKAANTSLLRVKQALADNVPTDLAAQDIRDAIYLLGSIVGEISTDEVLGNIFKNFCVGK